jgi:hypothetical protein
VAQKNRWHPCLLPDNYLRKLRQDLSDAEAAQPDSRLESTEEEMGENDE